MGIGSAEDLEHLLQKVFLVRHVRAAVKHFQAMTREFQQGAWEEATAKGGQFIEAAMKALYLHVGKTLPPARQFKAGRVMDDLERLPAGTVDDTIRLTIPRACRFAYDVASNRGARHDPAEIDPNEMDARAVMSTVAWTLAEMVRYSQKGSMTPEAVKEIVDALTQRKYPLIEEVDGRVYFHVPRASARDIAVLSLWQKYPGRMSDEELVAALIRHRFKRGNALMAVSRLGPFVDADEYGRLRLLQPGLSLAEQLIADAGVGTT